jgi:hypothetical protein
MMFVPDKGDGSLTLYVRGHGITKETRGDGPIELVKQGKTVMSVDLRGYGETETEPWRFSELHAGPNAAEYFIAYMSGRSLVGMRTEDILSARSVLIREGTKKLVRDGIITRQEALRESAHLIAVGETGVPALHAAALKPELFSRITIRDSITSWQSVIDTHVTIRQLENTVHGALKFYDLPDLIELAGPDIVTIESPRDATGKPIPVNEKTK